METSKIYLQALKNEHNLLGVVHLGDKRNIRVDGSLAIYSGLPGIVGCLKFTEEDVEEEFLQIILEGKDSIANFMSLLGGMLESMEKESVANTLN